MKHKGQSLGNDTWVWSDICTAKHCKEHTDNKRSVFFTKFYNGRPVEDIIKDLSQWQEQ